MDENELIIFENRKPQIKTPRVTPLEGVSTYAQRAYVLFGSREPLGFGFDKRGFVIAYLRSFAFICGSLDFNTGGN